MAQFFIVYPFVKEFGVYALMFSFGAAFCGLIACFATIIPRLRRVLPAAG
jgi:hypothetical protein